MTVTDKLRDGDIYRWHYHEPGNDGAWGRYHCKSCIGVVKNGVLCDTYLGSSSGGTVFYQHELKSLDLVRLGNLSDLNSASPYEADYYDDADIVDLRHANSSHGEFYLRKGARKSAKKMLEVAKRKLAQAESDARFAADRIAKAQEAIFLTSNGRTDVYL